MQEVVDKVDVFSPLHTLRSSFYIVPPAVLLLFTVRRYAVRNNMILNFKPDPFVLLIGWVYSQV